MTGDDAIYAARIELADFAIEVLWDTPAESFVERLLSGDVAFPSDEVNASLDEGFEHLRQFVTDNQGRPTHAVHDELAREYTRLFVGPRPPVVAHETHYREDTELIGKGLAEVQADYAAAEWSPPEEYPEEDDFVATELAFLRHLIERQRRGDEAAFEYERVFLDEHLLSWIDEFAADIREHTDEPLLLAAASVTEGLVDFEDDIVAQVVSG